MSNWFSRRWLLVLALVCGMIQPMSATQAAPRTSTTPTPDAVGGQPALELSQTISQEALLGDAITIDITATNTATTAVTDRGYNLSLIDTLPEGLSFTSASLTPSSVQPQSDGTTIVFWDNIADLEAGEEFTVSVSASLDASFGLGSQAINAVSGVLNSMPDNSGTALQASNQLPFQPQAIDIELKAKTSTAVAQVSGAGEYPAQPGAKVGADWPFKYEVTLRNNPIAASEDAIAKVILPNGIAYLGNVTFSIGNSTNPELALQEDGSLELTWNLGTLATARYNDPLVIQFDAAVPYAYRTGDDTAAEAGPFAGPMSGEIIPEDTRHEVSYEAQASYNNVSVADGTMSTPADDKPTSITSDYVTLRKAGNPETVGIGTNANWTLRWYVSEYYAATTVVVSDTLPDGMSYVDGSASITPDEVQADTPAVGQTTLIWNIDPSLTTPGHQDTITFQSSVDPTYEAAPYTGEPIVSGDALTNSRRTQRQLGRCYHSRSHWLAEPKQNQRHCEHAHAHLHQRSVECRHQ